MRQTIDIDLPSEAAFLCCYDAFRAAVQEVVDLPDRTADLLFRFLRQNAGKLSAPAREREFARLTQGEVERIEELYRSSFG